MVPSLGVPFIASLGFFLLFANFAHGWRRDPVQPTGFVLASNYFGLHLFDKLSQENEQRALRQNIFFSPYSVSIALAQLHQGSAGKTAKQLESTLGFQLAKLAGEKSLAALQVKNSTGEIFLREDTNATSYTLQAGNAVVYDQHFLLLEEYKQALKENFHAEVFQFDFAAKGDAVLDLINGWCANKTNGKIDKLLSQRPSASTKLALLNAIYFKASWKLKLDPNRTEQATFYGLNGEKFENVSFMQSKDYYNVGYLAEVDADLVEMQYEGEDLSFYALLPKDRNADLAILKKALNPWYIESAISRIYSREVELKLPKLALKANYELVPTLQSMGIEDVFASQSNLSALSTEANLAVDQVAHVASIDVNEEGSEAAAGTYIGIVRLSLPVPSVPYIFDHPFLFFIRHNRNGQLLFLGEVNRF